MDSEENESSNEKAENDKKINYISERLSNENIVNYYAKLSHIILRVKKNMKILTFIVI